MMWIAPFCCWLVQDPPFGIHLCGTDFCVLPEGPVVPVHDVRVRPYRGIPIFKPDTVVQHYLTPEEMAPFHAQVSSSAAGAPIAMAHVSPGSTCAHIGYQPQLCVAPHICAVRLSRTRTDSAARPMWARLA